MNYNKKNLIGKLCQIYEYQRKTFQVGIIINIDENYIYYKEFQQDGRYDGYRAKTLKYIRKITTNSSYLNDFKKIINDDGETFAINSIDDIFQYALERRKLIDVSCFEWECLHQFLVLDYKPKTIKAQKVNHCCELLNTQNITIKNIDFIKFDTRKLKAYDRIISNY